MTSIHVLRGCTPEPLAHYLKALGVLRLLSEQRDRATRGLWRDGHFTVATSLDRSSLLDFFLNHYEPTPILAPWNGGSGFYPKDNHEGIDAIRQSKGARFEAYRRAILGAEQLVGERTNRPSETDKSALLSAYARTQADDAYAWVSAAVALDRDGNGKYPALLGTGGNDGRLDFTNNFMQRLAEAIDMGAGTQAPGAARLLELALFGGAKSGLVDRAIGQFFPGAAGGANGTAGFSSDSRMNPWDFLLMLEGAVVLRVASLRRLDGAELPQAAAPFALRNTTEGYASAADADGSARGEQWLPLWGRPATFGEVERLFAEAKLASGRATAESALDAARAVARLGAARGVQAFQRFSFIERNGQANLAVPLGVIPVAASDSVRLLDEIDEWIDRLRRAARGEHAPASLSRELRAIEGAAFACTGAQASAEVWQRLVVALGAAEHGLVQRPKATYRAGLRPLPRLSSRWLTVIDDGLPETRVAAAIASTGGRELGPIRVHCAPLSHFLDRFETAGDGLAGDPRVVWSGRDLVQDLAACTLRRVVEGRTKGLAGFALDGALFAHLEDIAAFVERRLDDAKVAGLARGLMAVEFPGPRRAEGQRPLPGALATYAMFRSVYSPHMFGEQRTPNDPTALRQLLSNRLDDALGTARSRLVAMGLRPKLDRAVGDGESCARIVASLAIPVSRHDYARLRHLVSRPFDDSEETSP